MKYGKSIATPETIIALRFAIKSFGLSGLVNQSKITWPIVAGAALGLEVKSQQLAKLESFLANYGFLAK